MFFLLRKSRSEQPSPSDLGGILDVPSKPGKAIVTLTNLQVHILIGPDHWSVTSLHVNIVNIVTLTSIQVNIVIFRRFKRDPPRNKLRVHDPIANY